MNEPKKLIFGNDVRKAIKSGVDTVCNAVKVTLGPSGKYVLFESAFRPGVNTNDGVTVAKQIILEDEFENLAAQKVIKAASKTNDISGDGTTTACILTQAIINRGLKNIAAGGDSVQIVKGIKEATNNIVTKLKEMSQKISKKCDTKHVATISAGSEEIGELVSEAVHKVGKDGVVTIEEGGTEKTTMDMVEGLQFDRGYLAPLFVTDERRMEAILEDCYILPIDQKIQSMQELMKIVQQIAPTGKPVLIVCNGIDNETLGTLVINKLRGTLKSVAVYTPGWGDRRKEQLKDIAILTGGIVFCDQTGNKLNEATLEQLGTARKVIVDKDHTTIVSGSGSKKELTKRIEDIKGQIEICKSEYDTDKLKERLAKLSGGIAIINVGGVTESEMRAKKFKIEDALHATQSALKEGIVEGGGCAYLKCDIIGPSLMKSADESIGWRIVLEAIKEPAKQIAENAGKNGEVVVNEIIKTGKGYDALCDKYTDMITSGIIDPTLTVKTALENAASIACLMLTTECLISKIKEK